MQRFARFTIATAVAWTVMLAPVAAHATFPGDNGRIAFARDRGNGAEIYTMSRTGTNLRRLTRSDRSAWYPFPSPDGTKIVY